MSAVYPPATRRVCRPPISRTGAISWAKLQQAHIRRFIHLGTALSTASSAQRQPHAVWPQRSSSSCRHCGTLCASNCPTPPLGQLALLLHASTEDPREERSVLRTEINLTGELTYSRGVAPNSTRGKNTHPHVELASDLRYCPLTRTWRARKCRAVCVRGRATSCGGKISCWGSGMA
jgi:hypothetical protein